MAVDRDTPAWQCTKTLALAGSFLVKNKNTPHVLRTRGHVGWSGDDRVREKS